MRRLTPKALPLVLVVIAAACGRLDPSLGAGEEPSSPAVDAREAAIHEAVVRSLAEFPEQGTVSIYDHLCRDADSPGAVDCAEVIPAAERAALLSALSDWPSVGFVSETERLEKDIFAGKGGMLIRLGPIAGEGDKVNVPASEYCGGLCGRGGVWIVELGSGGWSVTGSVGGSWIS